MSSLIRPRLTSGRLSLLTSTFRLFIFRAVDPTVLRDFRQPICVYRFFWFRFLVNIEEMQHCRQLTAPPYKRRDATASGQNATETQAIVPAAIQLLMLALATLSISGTALAPPHATVPDVLFSLCCIENVTFSFLTQIILDLSHSLSSIKIK